MLEVNGSFLSPCFLLALAAAGQACSDGTDYGQEPTAVATKTATIAASGSGRCRRGPLRPLRARLPLAVGDARPHRRRDVISDA